MTGTGRSRGCVASALLILAIAATACTDKATKGTATTPLPEGTPTAADYSATVTNTFVPLSTVRVTVFEGKEGDTRIRIESRVLDTTETIAGVEVRPVEVKEYENGRYSERTLDYYAQHRDGGVWYFGERVENIKDGKVVGHGGQWLAGVGTAQAGLFMPADPQVGQSFEQERAPGVAEDRSKVIEVGVGITTAAGTFSGCIKTEDYAPLDRATEHKYYCPGVGLVREETSGGTRVDLISYS
jgi:hypothetical protein